MMTTLLKHEWLHTRGTLGMLYGIVSLVVVLGSLLAATGWPLLSLLGIMLAMGCLLMLVPAAQLLLVADFWRTGYGRTGYFTHSIPVRGATIFRAKLAWALIASLASLILAVLLGLVSRGLMVLLAQSSETPFDFFGDTWSTFISVAPGWMIVVGPLLLLASILVWPVYYYFAVSVGHESRFAEMGAAGPIVIFVILYICIQIAAFLGMVLIPFAVGMEGGSLGIVPFNVLSEMAAGANGDTEVMPVGFVASMGLLLVYCAWRTARSWNRKVALA